MRQFVCQLKGSHLRWDIQDNSNLEKKEIWEQDKGSINWADGD